MVKTFDKLFSIIDKVFEYGSFLLLGGMTLLITIQVVCRYVLHAPLGWSEELARFGFIWMTFFAGYLGARRAQHISVELVQDLFPTGVKKVMKCVSMLIATGFFLMVVYYLILQWDKLATQKSSALQIPMSWVYFGMLLGSLFIGLSYLYEAAKVWKADSICEAEEKEVSAE